MKRIKAVDLRAAQLRDRMIRAAFLAVPSALRCRPDGARVTFDNAARGSCPSSPWRIDQEAVRAVAVAAAKDGRPITVAETRTRIRAYFAAREADALSFLPSESEIGIIQAVLEETIAQGPADVHGAELLAKPTCHSRLLAFAASARQHARRAFAAADAAERSALTVDTTGVRLWR